MVIHAWKSLSRKKYCKDERNFEMANLDLYHNLVKFSWKKLSGHSWFPMDGALVNAGSHNPPSNVFYMVHKALGGSSLCPYCNDIALVLWLYWICTFNCKWYNVVTIWSQTLLLYWFYIVFMLFIFCIYVVLIFLHCMCVVECRGCNVATT